MTTNVSERFLRGKQATDGNHFENFHGFPVNHFDHKSDMSNKGNNIGLCENG